MEQGGLTPAEKPRRWKPSFKLSGNLALITGITMGVLAAVVHPANIVNWLVNNIFGTNFTIHSIFVTVPVLTSVGFIIGSFIAAKKNKEFKLRPGPVRDNVLAFILGFLIINFGLLWGSCPIRTAILASYGMFFAILMLGMIVLGVIVACLYIKWKVRRA
jgi:hypothetical protein